MKTARDWRLPMMAMSLWLTSTASAVWAAQLDGELALEARHFPQQNPQADWSSSSSAALDLDFYHDWGRDRRLVVDVFGRWDQRDNERTHVDLRELYWRQSLDSVDIFIGVRKVFWGVTESVHLVDIINQTDGAENLDGEDKLGQPMVQLVWEQDWGTLEGFVLPYFRERTFAGEAGRFAPPLPLERNFARYESDREEKHVDWAGRWSHSLGDWDIGVSYFDGTSREPIIEPVLTATGELVLRPFYAQLDQASVDLQYTTEAWLWKLEMVSRELLSKRSSAMVGGLEYTFYGVFDTVADIGVVVEYQWDDRRGLQRPVTDNDVVLGSRLTLNDAEDTDFLALMVLDTDNQTRFYSIEADRRLNERWELSLEGRFFSQVDEQDPLAIMANDDYWQLQITRYF